MNADEFVRGIETAVRDSAVDSTLENLNSPPGRMPPEDLMRASAWFAGLGEDAKSNIEYIIRLAANHAAFGFLTALDNARWIPGKARGEEFHLYSVSGGTSIRLNDEHQKPLNNKFRL